MKPTIRTPTIRRGPVITKTALAAVLLASCSGGSDPKSAADSNGPSTSAAADTTPNIETPGPDWDQIGPEEAGFNKAALDKLAADAEAANSNCMVVTRGGKLVAEYYFNGTNADTTQEVWSATKSVSSTIVGIAQEQGLLDIDDSASKYIPEWATGDAAKVTIKDLLSNDSGRHYDYETDYLKMAVAAEDKNAFSIALGQDDPPDKVWNYNNSAIQTLSQVLEVTVGQDPVDFANENLLEPIGMTDSKMTTDKSGNMLTFMGLQSSCPDMARFGLLFLNHGMWGGEQIVPSAWVEEATTPSQDLNPSYGYLWWLNTSSDAGGSGDVATGAATMPRQQMVPGVPDDVFFALGLGNQIVSVIPSEDIVAVRLGGAKAEGFGQAELTRGVLDALK